MLTAITLEAGGNCSLGYCFCSESLWPHKHTSINYTATLQTRKIFKGRRERPLECANKLVAKVNRVQKLMVCGGTMRAIGGRGYQSSTKGGSPSPGPSSYPNRPEVYRCQKDKHPQAGLETELPLMTAAGHNNVHKPYYLTKTPVDQWGRGRTFG